MDPYDGLLVSVDDSLDPAFNLGVGRVAIDREELKLSLYRV